MRKLFVLLTITVAIGFTACSTANQHATHMPAEELVAVSEDLQDAQAENTPLAEDDFSIDHFADFFFLGNDGNIKYAWRRDSNKNAVFYAIRRDESLPNGGTAEVLATFPPDHSVPVGIAQFGLLDDWIILAVGSFQGSGAFWFGNFVRMRNDGSLLEHLYLTDDHRFYIMDGWLYYNFWQIQGDGRRLGVWRMRADGLEHKDLGDLITAFHVAVDGYLYGVFRGTSSTDLVRVNPETGKKITLFRGETLHTIEGRGSPAYVIREIGEDFVHFSALIVGNNEIYVWREGVLFSQGFMVDKDGENLTSLGIVDLESRIPWTMEQAEWEDWQTARKLDLWDLRGRILGNVSAELRLEELSQIIYHAFTRNTANIASISLFWSTETTETVHVEAFFEREHGVLPRFAQVAQDNEIFWFMQEEYNHQQSVAAMYSDLDSPSGLFRVGMSLGLLPHHILLEIGCENPLTEPTEIFLEIRFNTP